MIYLNYSHERFVINCRFHRTAWKLVKSLSNEAKNGIVVSKQLEKGEAQWV